MLKFYIVKREEFGRAPAFEGEKEFYSFEEFMRYAEYHRPYIEEIRTLEAN